MRHDIAFLHTAAVHEATFSALLEEIAPEVRAVHSVRSDLLATARAEGIGAEPRETIAVEMRAAASRSGASIVVCTCSTLGRISRTVPAHSDSGASG